jgi:hypothetical protein
MRIQHGAANGRVRPSSFVEKLFWRAAVKK